VIRHFWSRQFAVFLLTGGFAALVNFASRILYSRWMSYSNAILLAYVTGMITAFVLARIFVFRGGRNDVMRSALIFTAVNVVAVLQTWLISLLLAYEVLPWMGVRRFVPEVAHAVGVAFPVFTSYLGHKFWSFR
jgi:putative flippase GtrA